MNEKEEREREREKGKGEKKKTKALVFPKSESVKREAGALFNHSSSPF